MADGRDEEERLEANTEPNIRFDGSSRCFRERIKSDPESPHGYALAYSQTYVLTKIRLSEMRLSRSAVLMDLELLGMDLGPGHDDVV